ncbi:MAG TPA: LysR family transcriptional regulator [Solirubrobacteraceae bacterium]|nr:LysR family transcriptional regulator [Solirubrobacteraceae bacterium]
MELRQLEYLDAVVRHGGFVRAAQEVYVTQSALSQQITRLESELGLALLRRGPRGVEPTPAGVEFLSHARAILGELAEARAAVSEHLDGARGVVRVAATVYDAPALPEALVAFHRHHPQVQLALHHGAAAQVTEQLAAGTADIAVLAISESRPKLPAQVSVRTLAEQRLWLISAVDDPLARSERARGGAALELDELRGRPVIMPERGTALRELLLRAFTEAGFSPLPLFETSDPQTIRQLVAAGLGLSVVPEGWLSLEDPPVATLPVRLPAYRIAMLASTEPRVPARDLLAEHLARALTDELES